MLFGPGIVCTRASRWCSPAARKANCDPCSFNNLSLRRPLPDLGLHLVSIVLRSLSRLVRPNLRSIQEEEPPSFSSPHPFHLQASCHCQLVCTMLKAAIAGSTYENRRSGLFRF
jgi:hypothetical protein